MALLIQPSFSKGELGPELFGRVDTAAYQVGLATAYNCIVHATGGASNRGGLHILGFCYSNSITSRLRRFQFKTSDTYLLEFSDQVLRIIRNNAFVMDLTKLVTGVSLGSPVTLTSAAHGMSSGDRVYVTGLTGPDKLNYRWFNLGAGTSANTLALYDPVTLAAVDGTGYAAWASGGSVDRVYTVATPYVAADLLRLKFSQSADVVTITHPSYALRRLSRAGHASWSFSTPAYTPSILPPTGAMASGVITGTTTVNYQITTIKETTLEESLPVDVSATDSADIPFDASNFVKNTLAWDAVSGADKYSIYKEQGGRFGFIGESQGLSFLDDNFAPDLSTSPPRARTPISASGDYPGTSAYYEQRQVMGGSTNSPDTSYYTRIGDYDSFSQASPIQDDDGFNATLNSSEVNEIRHFVAGNDLLVLTSGAEWRVNSGADSVFAAVTIKQKPQSAWGSSHLEPIIIGDTVLFVTADNISIRNIGYSLQKDGYTGSDLTALSPHMFAGSAGLKRAIDWSFSRSPEPILHVVRDDGLAACMTFQQEQEVVGWVRWGTSGKFEAIESVKASPDDPDVTTYFVVRRIVNGHVIRTIEYTDNRRFDDVRDAFFVDSGVTLDNPIAISAVLNSDPCLVTTTGPHNLQTGDEVFVSDIEWEPDIDDFETETQPDQLNDGPYEVTRISDTQVSLNEVTSADFNAYISGGNLRVPQTRVQGLGHLEGRQVVALADGNVVQNLTVADAQVILPRAAGRVHVGLRYTSDVVALRPETRQGTIQGKITKVTHVTVRHNKSRGMFIGMSFADMDEVKQRQFEDYGKPIDLMTGDKKIPMSSDWEADNQIHIRQLYPLPMTILALVPNIEIED